MGSKYLAVVVCLIALFGGARGTQATVVNNATSGMGFVPTTYQDAPYIIHFSGLAYNTDTSSSRAVTASLGGYYTAGGTVTISFNALVQNDGSALSCVGYFVGGDSALNLHSFSAGQTTVAHGFTVMIWTLTVTTSVAVTGALGMWCGLPAFKSGGTYAGVFEGNGS